MMHILVVPKADVMSYLRWFADMLPVFLQLASEIEAGSTLAFVGDGNSPMMLASDSSSYNVKVRQVPHV